MALYNRVLAIVEKNFNTHMMHHIRVQYNTRNHRKQPIRTSSKIALPCGEKPPKIEGKE
jgi:hypothetical protein